MRSGRGAWESGVGGEPGNAVTVLVVSLVSKHPSHVHTDLLVP